MLKKSNKNDLMITIKKNNTVNDEELEEFISGINKINLNDEIIKDKDSKEIKQEINKNKGGNCSIEGKKYENIVYNVVNKCYFDKNKQFNTQNINELGGCSAENDLICNWLNNTLIPIEIKKINTSDWMQCSLKYNVKQKKWIGSLNNKIPNGSKKIFEKLIDNIIIFNGKIPPFFEKNITHDEWKEIKNKTTDFNDCYIDCPNNTIKKLYSSKDCKYIQISELGLYHLGEDICGFNVPEFICEQELRIRTKIHSKCDKNGYCKLSVTLSCKPKNIKKIIKSNYTLDNNKKIPLNLIYK